MKRPDKAIKHLEKFKGHGGIHGVGSVLAYIKYLEGQRLAQPEDPVDEKRRNAKGCGDDAYCHW